MKWFEDLSLKMAERGARRIEEAAERTRKEREEEKRLEEEEGEKLALYVQRLIRDKHPEGLPEYLVIEMETFPFKNTAFFSKEKAPTTKNVNKLMRLLPEYQIINVTNETFGLQADQYQYKLFLRKKEKASEIV